MSNNRHSLLVQMSTIRELADQPANAIGNLKKIFDMAKSAAARLANDRRQYKNAPVDIAPDFFYVADNLGTVILNHTNPAVPFKFSRSGIVLFATCSSKEATAAAAAGLELGIKANGSEDIMLNGIDGATTMPFDLISPLGGRAMPIGRRVQKGETWQLTINNTTSGTLTPTVAFGFKDEE